MVLAVILFAASSGVLGTLMLVLVAPFIVAGGALQRLRNWRRTDAAKDQRFEDRRGRRVPIIIEGDYVVLDERPPSKGADACAAARVT